ncbi:lysylphosphatidylglycerol synthase domain-containing protein [Azorhizobium doebereinerae]|uniref:lysylphosphatidylglycerol synthase domain-containing protein n=1 Tax=Azorhizobium doebereinerae TaxID=281091 RepID=UPI00042A6B83|nr:lysylphosphatidylglycerol synthase domain-containing protein [Azorhizobium doebereinerae]
MSVPSRVWRFLREKVGLHGLGFIASLVVIGFAITVLYRMLHKLNFADVVAALQAKDPLHVAIAFVLVACAYITLTFYDWFALRTIGKSEVPYRVAALSGFCSYSVGHNVGFTVFTGGSVRYRIYSAWGLNAVDVAKICFVAGLTFWLGNVAVLGLGILIHPDAATAVDQLPPFVNRLLGVAALAALVGYVVWVSAAPRKIGRASWFVTLPAGKTTLLQIGIGILDLSLCAAAMYMLMPASPYIDPISLSVIFVTATLLGFASHAPGGLGVFDAALLVALPQFEAGEMVGALLVFRLFYYIVPFALALTLLGGREIYLGGRRRAAGAAETAAAAPPVAESKRVTAAE